MEIRGVYPRFTLNDVSNRALEYERKDGRFYRKWLNPTPETPKHLYRKEISRSQFAYALLAKIEWLATGQTDFDPVIIETEDNGKESVLDKFFGPKRTP